MGLRYRKQVKIAPGIKLNISKSGVSTSIGKRGATMNFSGRGTKATVGIPGSGFSYSKQLTSRKKDPAVSLKKAERKAMAESGMSKREMKELRRIVKRDRTRLQGLNDEEIAAEVRGSLRRRQRRAVWILGIILIVLIVYAVVK